ncbi:SGNH/GDSL hydrolase family protein [Pararobbsia silviterrae]|uniref:SGNH/GDSL hydrolase family protein n=1 Tax=Pararobbsia silviterrae TaxID=1792498 RepID=A0A494XS44_9BURK|nr:SGNH/GDSL hydrolase family protein [Pararobbsia silviterrae]RKP53457.1 SGNH/GDSL hydrolase family protein [Pararobbsia silviterrae]
MNQWTERRARPARRHVLRVSVRAGRLGSAALLIGSLIGSACAATASDVGAARGNWVNAWQGSPTTGATFDTKSCPSDVGLENQTIRNVVYLSAGGQRVRIKVSNAGGTAPLKVGEVTVAPTLASDASTSAAPRTVTFGGASAIVVPAGSEAISDPVALPVRALTSLAVNVFVPEKTGPATQHFLATATNYLADGNQSHDAAATAYAGHASCWMFVSGVDVDAPRNVDGTVVFLGDSITDGYMSTADKNQRFPDFVARAMAKRRGPTFSVSNAGIAGNELLTNRDLLMFGVPAATRAARDVWTQPHLKAVVLLEGINDIGDKSAKAPEIIGAMQQLIAQAHAAGVPIFGGTLVPFMGSNSTYKSDYGTPAGEAERLKVNEWIRTSHAFDGVIDFDEATRDPADPSRMKAAYDSGDHLHPSDAGYEAMAREIDVDALMRAKAGAAKTD